MQYTIFTQNCVSCIMLVINAQTVFKNIHLWEKNECKETENEMKVENHRFNSHERQMKLKPRREIQNQHCSERYAIVHSFFWIKENTHMNTYSIWSILSTIFSWGYNNSRIFLVHLSCTYIFVLYNYFS